MLVSLLSLAAATLGAPINKRSDSFSSSVSFSSSTNVTIGNSDSFVFRQSSFIKTDLLPFVVYSSSEFTADDDSAEGSLIAGMAYAGNPFPSVSDIGDDLGIGGIGGNILDEFDDALAVFSAPPTVWSTYAEADAQFSFDATDANLASLDVSASASFIASMYTKLEEISAADGSVARTWDLKDLDWDISNVQNVAHDGIPNALQYVTFSAPVGQTGATMTMTLAVSKIVGVLEEGGATMTPKNMESLIDIAGYNVYGDDSNFLRLTMHVGAASVAGSGTASLVNSGATFVAGSGSSQIYFAVNPTVSYLDGTTGTATVTFEGINLEDLQAINSALASQFSSNIDVDLSYQKIMVDYPAGVSDVRLDPSMGFEVPDSAAVLLPTFFTIVLALFALSMNM